MAKPNDTPLPEMQVFRSHQRAESNAAVQEAARHPEALLTIETHQNGETVAMIHTRRVQGVLS